MELTSDIVLEIPLWHMAALLLIMMAFLALRKHAAGLVGGILFLMYWGYIYNFDKFVHQSFQFNYAAVWFFIIGAINAIIVAILSICAFSIDD